MVKDFLYNILHRGISPVKDFTYGLYIILAIFIFGATGVWFEWIKYILVSNDHKNITAIQASLGAFYPPLIGAACLQLFLESYRTPSKLMGIFSISFLLISIAIAIVIRIFEFNGTYSTFTWIITFLLVLVGIFLWSAANSNNPDLQTVDKNSSIGGDDTDKPLQGDTKDFTE